MKRIFPRGTAVLAAGIAMFSGAVMAGANEPDQFSERSSSSGSAWPIQGAPEAAAPAQAKRAPSRLKASDRVGMNTNSDGTITHDDYTAEMERRWNGLDKNASGELPAERADQGSAGPLSVPSY
jgi:hypothetical protein